MFMVNFYNADEAKSVQRMAKKKKKGQCVLNIDTHCLDLSSQMIIFQIAGRTVGAHSSAGRYLSCRKPPGGPRARMIKRGYFSLM